MLDGTIIGQCMQRHRHQEFIRFLNAIEAVVPAGKLVHVIGTLKSWNIIDQLPRINVPVLLISGRHDEATPAVVQPFADGIKGARWEIFENSAHVPHIEETERCMQVIGDFLADHDKGAGRTQKTKGKSKSSREKRRRR